MDEKAIIKKLKIFAETIRKGYNHSTYTKELCYIKEYNQASDSEKEFVQIPIRIKMEKDDFDGTVNNTILGRDLGEDITNGEFNYIISKLKQIEKKEVIKNVDFEGISIILSNLPNSFEPQFLLIPIDLKYYQSVHKLVDNGIAKYEGGDLVIYMMGHNVKVIWSSNFRHFDEVYLLGKKSIEWIYKPKKYMKSIPNFEDYNYQFDKEDSLLSFIYKERVLNEIDIIARVVAIAKINETKVRQFIIKK